MLRPVEPATQNRKIYRSLTKVAGFTKRNISLRGLENRYRAFKTQADKQGLYKQIEKAKT
jgi:hypothetical protein